MTIRTTILDQMANIAKQQHKTLQPLTDDLALLDSGLDSLCLAILVANLDDELGIDPFGSGDDVAVPATIGDFVRLYEATAVRL
jgi:acyl carrier protein